MNKNEYQKLIKMRDVIVEYLDKEKSINEDALTAYDKGSLDDNESEIKVMRERERIKLRDRIVELKRHIEVIKRMYPRE